MLPPGSIRPSSRCHTPRRSVRVGPQRFDPRGIRAYRDITGTCSLAYRRATDPYTDSTVRVHVRCRDDRASPMKPISFLPSRPIFRLPLSPLRSRSTSNDLLYYTELLRMLMRPAGNFYVNTCLLAPVLRGYPSPLLLLLLLPRFPERRWKRSGFRTLPKGASYVPFNIHRDCVHNFPCNLCGSRDYLRFPSIEIYGSCAWIRVAIDR